MAKNKLSPEEVAKLTKRLKGIETMSKTIGDNFDKASLKPIAKDADTINRLFESMNDQIDQMDESWESINASISSQLTDFSKMGEATNIAKNNLRSVQGITEKLKYDAAGITDLNLKDLTTLKSKLSQNQKELTDQAAIVAKKYKITDLANENLSALENTTEEEKALLLAAQGGFKNLQQSNDLLDKRIKKEEIINDKVGLTGALIKGMGKIPILGDIIDTEKALDAARKNADEGGSSISAMGAGLKSMGKDMGKAFMDPLSSIMMLVKGFQMLLKFGFEVDTQVTNLSKSMGTSKEAATVTRDRMAEIQGSAENVYMTIENQVAAQLELADAFGAVLGFTEQQIAAQVTLTKNIGLSAEEAKGVQELAMISGTTTDDVTNSVIKQNIALYKQTGIRLSDKKVLQDVSKVQGQLRAQYQNNPKLIAAAVVQAKQLGIEMGKAKSMADGLLDFEKSIEDELTAELLTGKDLNLEKARGLALAGKSVEAAKEMLGEVGSIEEFSKMNVIAQRAMADAVNMTTDELANSLVQQDNLKNLSKQTQENIEKQAEALRAKGQIDEANQLMNSLASEEEAKKALSRISDQDKFNEGIEKMKKVLGEIMAGPAKNLANWVTGLLKHTTLIKGVFIAIGAIIAGKIAASIGMAIVNTIKWAAASATQAAAAISSASAATLGIAIPAIIGGIVAGGAAMYGLMKVNDMVMPGGGDNGYGKRTLLGPEGAISLNNKDTVIAGTDLFGDDVVSKGKGEIKLDQGKNMDETNSLLRQVLDAIEKGSIITMDGSQVGESINIGAREVQ